MNKVLIVEDMKWQHKNWTEQLDGKVEVISALSIEEAKEKFKNNPDISAIVMDACVPGDYPTTQSLTHEFRKTFSGPIIATSSIPEFRKMLIKAGCNHETVKRELPQKLLEVLNLT